MAYYNCYLDPPNSGNEKDSHGVYFTVLLQIPFHRKSVYSYNSCYCPYSNKIWFGVRVVLDIAQGTVFYLSNSLSIMIIISI